MPTSTLTLLAVVIWAKESGQSHREPQMAVSAAQVVLDAAVLSVVRDQLPVETTLRRERFGWGMRTGSSWARVVESAAKIKRESLSCFLEIGSR